MIWTKKIIQKIEEVFKYYIGIVSEDFQHNLDVVVEALHLVIAASPRGFSTTIISLCTNVPVSPSFGGDLNRFFMKPFMLYFYFLSCTHYWHLLDSITHTCQNGNKPHRPNFFKDLLNGEKRVRAIHKRMRITRVIPK